MHFIHSTLCALHTTKLNHPNCRLASKFPFSCHRAVPDLPWPHYGQCVCVSPHSRQLASSSPPLSNHLPTCHLGSVNLSTQVPKLIKTEPFQSWPTTCHPQFHQFEHASAQISKPEASHSCPTTHHFGSANLSMLMCSNLQNWGFLILPNHLPPQFCQFKHTSAQIGKTEHLHTTSFLSSQASLHLPNHPPSSILPI